MVEVANSVLAAYHCKDLKTLYVYCSTEMFYITVRKRVKLSNIAFTEEPYKFFRYNCRFHLNLHCIDQQRCVIIIICPLRSETNPIVLLNSNS
jgi:hypothetical protein